MQIAHLGQVSESASQDTQPLTAQLGLGIWGGGGRKKGAGGGIGQILPEEVGKLRSCTFPALPRLLLSLLEHPGPIWWRPWQSPAVMLTSYV